MNKNLIIKKLISIQYSEEQADSVADELLMIDNSLSTLFLTWIEGSLETDITIQGFSLLDLKNKYQMTYPAALLTMDWLIKEPQIAIEAISKGIK